MEEGGGGVREGEREGDEDRRKQKDGYGWHARTYAVGPLLEASLDIFRRERETLNDREIDILRARRLER